MSKNQIENNNYELGRDEGEAVEQLPDISFVSCIFDVVADGLEHSLGRSHVTRVENLHGQMKGQLGKF